MKISAKYLRALERYLEWERVKTPFSGSISEDGAMRLPAVRIPNPLIPQNREEVKHGGSVTAAEWLCEYESRGNILQECCELEMLGRYWRGKANLDWWNKETGKNWPFIPEEFLGMLGPLPFIDLFGRAPITRIVRYFHDNHYRLWEFRLDSLMQIKVEDWKMPYYERDDRHSALRNAGRMVQVKWIDPAIYRLRRKIEKCFEVDS